MDFYHLGKNGKLFLITFNIFHQVKHYLATCISRILLFSTNIFVLIVAFHVFDYFLKIFKWNCGSECVNGSTLPVYSYKI